MRARKAPPVFPHRFVQTAALGVALNSAAARAGSRKSSTKIYKVEIGPILVQIADTTLVPFAVNSRL